MPSRVEIYEADIAPLPTSVDNSNSAFITIEQLDGKYTSLIIDCARDGFLSTLLICSDLETKLDEADLADRTFLKPADEVVTLTDGEAVCFEVPLADEARLEIIVGHENDAASSQFNTFFDKSFTKGGTKL